MANYKTLNACKLSMQLVKDVYTLTKKYPKEELFALTSQTKRSAVSIPSNIAEGLGRQYKKDTLQFLYISRGSLYELETQLNIASMINVISEEELKSALISVESTLKVLNGLINSIELRTDLK